ncbi:MAG: 16S rRNA (cytosine(1402)-N(4))-methyltransferase RsmH [Actinobacteria bacterium]|nr:16S rRNA (cytosine(1402)-N(4))-methyltransferase RsmH [Actinomycetota bacterium]
MAERVVALLAVAGRRPGLLVDATVGAGGHALALLAASSADTRLVAFDRDADALDLARTRLSAHADRVTFVHAGHDRLTEYVAPVVAREGPVLGVLYDLGASSMQLDRPERGFSFRATAPLDMRMDADAALTAAEVVNGRSVEELTRIIRWYGEERFARRIAQAVVAARPLRTTTELAGVVERAVPAATRRPGLHPATRTFQALRIEVNGELERLRSSLPQALGLVAPPGAEGRGGRVAVLSYHSLEDRIVKRSFAEATTGCVCPPDLPVCACGRSPLATALTRGAERPGAAEVAGNPRARAARLRAVERTAAAPHRGRG